MESTPISPKNVYTVLPARASTSTQNDTEDESDNETSQCITTGSVSSAITVPISMDHIQQSTPKKNDCIYIPMINSVKTACIANPLAYLQHDSKSDCSSVFIDTCKICHQPSDPDDPLICPCRCMGSLQYIHGSCLTRWLEVLSKRSRKPPKCELCGYQYNRHKKFKFHHWRFPKISKHDKILHIVFIVNLILMVSCAAATIMCFLSDKGQISKMPHKTKVELTTEEIITLSCGVLFFVSFFIAMSVQIKAKHTVYQLIAKFITHNMEWEIDAYDETKDAEVKKYKVPPVSV